MAWLQNQQPRRSSPGTTARARAWVYVHSGPSLVFTKAWSLSLWCTWSVSLATRLGWTDVHVGPNLVAVRSYHWVGIPFIDTILTNLKVGVSSEAGIRRKPTYQLGSGDILPNDGSVHFLAVTREVQK